MITLEQWKQLLDHVQQGCALIRLTDKERQRDELQQTLQNPTLWSDPATARQLTQQLHYLQAEIETWTTLRAGVQDSAELATLLGSDLDPSTSQQLQSDYERYNQQYQALETMTLLSGEFDDHDAIVSIHAGAGGVDAQDWAGMLLRMVLRFAQAHDWTVDIIDQTRGAEAGIKSTTLQIHGLNAYGLLQSEHGVHRLVRISPFDAESMRHTSFASIEVIPDFGEVPELELPDSDLRIDVFRSGGNGGQSVNTTDSAVRIVHIPTGLTVTCQNEKSQHQNKAAALRILKSKLYQIQLQERAAAQAAVKGQYKSAAWGNQIRSYVLHPYKLVKDHRTNYESTDPESVLEGELGQFIDAYLRWKQA